MSNPDLESKMFISVPVPERSVADPGSLSRILIFTHPGSRIRISDPASRIPDPKTAAKERGEKKISCHTFFLVTNFT